jgi:hypothetical protein
MKVDTLKTFKTNTDLYNIFVYICKTKKIKVYERLNELIADDVSKSSVIPVNQFIFENKETLQQEPADVCAEN